MPGVLTPGGRIGDPSPVGKPGGRQNWVDKRGGLPKYIRMVAHAMLRNGHSEGRAIALAVAAMKRWARGGDHVSPKVQAAAQRALAQWEAMKSTKRLDGIIVMGDAAFEASTDTKQLLEMFEAKLAKETTKDKNQNSNSVFNGKHPRNPDGTFKYKNDSGTGDASRGSKDANAKDGEVTGRISDAQDRLIKAGMLGEKDGHNGHGVDGLLGPKTEAALKKYQKARKLKVTGKLDAATQKSLGVKSKSSSGKKSLDAGNINGESATATEQGEGMNISYKSAKVGAVEVVDDQRGIIDAIVSVTGIVDNVNDVIEPGAYTKTLTERKPKGVWSHDWNSPVSKTLEAVELMPGDPRLPKTLPSGDPWPREAGAVRVKMQFNLNTERGRTAYEDVKFFDSDQEWSIGYNVPAGQAKMKDGKRYIKALQWFEYSPVLFGAMPIARTATIKGAQLAYKSLLGTTEHFDSQESFDAWVTEMKALAAPSGIETKDDGPGVDVSESGTGDNVEVTESVESEKVVEDDSLDFDNDIDDEEDPDYDPDFDDDDDEEVEEKSAVALSPVAVDLIEEVVKSLSAVLSAAQPDGTNGTDERKWDDQGFAQEFAYKGEPTTTLVADAVESLGDLIDDNDYNELMDDAETFDAAVKAGEEQAAEDSGGSLLDYIEQAIDAGVEPGVETALQDVATAINKALTGATDDGDGADSEDPATDQEAKRLVRSHVGAERYGLPIGVKVSAVVIPLDDSDLSTEEKSTYRSTSTAGVHGVDWIWEGEKWSDFRHLWDKKPTTPKGTFHHGPRSANSSNPKASMARNTPVSKLTERQKVQYDKLDADKKKKVDHLLTNGVSGTRAIGIVKNQIRMNYTEQSLMNKFKRTVGKGGVRKKADDLAVETKKDYTSEQRDEMAKSGMAMPDGSFPIKDKEDLSNAIQSVGRAADSDAAKDHIKKRAKALGATDMLPTSWDNNGDEGSSESKADSIVIEKKWLDDITALAQPSVTEGS